MESFSNKRQFTQRPEADPDRQIREGGGGRGEGGAVFLNFFFSALRALVWSKNKGVGRVPPAPSPGSATDGDDDDQKLSRRDLAVRLTHHDQPLCTCTTHFGTSIFRPGTT